MTPEPSHDAAEQLEEIHEEQGEQVLERESVETELMDEGRSDVGAKIEDVETDE